MPLVSGRHSALSTQVATRTGQGAASAGDALCHLTGVSAHVPETRPTTRCGSPSAAACKCFLSTAREDKSSAIYIRWFHTMPHAQPVYKSLRIGAMAKLDRTAPTPILTSASRCSGCFLSCSWPSLPTRGRHGLTATGTTTMTKFRLRTSMTSRNRTETGQLGSRSTENRSTSPSPGLSPSPTSHTRGVWRMRARSLTSQSWACRLIPPSPTGQERGSDPMRFVLAADGSARLGATLSPGITIHTSSARRSWTAGMCVVRHLLWTMWSLTSGLCFTGTRQPIRQRLGGGPDGGGVFYAPRALSG